MKKIFIVEDDKSICMELVEILENEGYAASYLTDFEHSKEEDSGSEGRSDFDGY